MIHTTFKFKGHYITVEAIYFKGYPETLEEPGENESFEIQQLRISEQEFEDVEELATFLNMEEKELDFIIETHLKLANNEHF